MDYVERILELTDALRGMIAEYDALRCLYADKVGSYAASAVPRAALNRARELLRQPYSADAE